MGGGGSILFQYFKKQYMLIFSNLYISILTVFESIITLHCKREPLLKKTSFVDLFHKKQLIKTVVIPIYNLTFIAFGLSNEACDRLDKKLMQ